MPTYFRHYCFLQSTWHFMFSHPKFQNGINISYITFLQIVRKYWTHTPIATIHRIFSKKFPTVRPETLTRRRRRNTKAFAKRFALHVYEIKKYFIPLFKIH